MNECWSNPRENLKRSQRRKSWRNPRNHTRRNLKEYQKTNRFLEKSLKESKKNSVKGKKKEIPINISDEISKANLERNNARI